MEKDLVLNTDHEFLDIAKPQEKIDLVVRLACESVVWVKLNEGGFLVDNDKVIPEINGIVVDVNPYYVKWIDKKADKIHFAGQKAPDGYEINCDIKIDVGGTLIGLSLPKTSTIFHLARYLKFLEKSGLKMNRVITRIRSKVVSNSHGKKYCVALFERIENLPNPVPVQADVDVVDVPVINSSATPQTDNSSNPWA